MSDILAGFLLFLTNYHLSLLVLAMLICFIISIHKQARFNTWAESLDGRLRHMIKIQDSNLQVLSKMQRTSHQHLEMDERGIQRLEDISKNLIAVIDQAENYTHLLVGIRDFYAGLKHFQAGMDQGSLMTAELGRTLEQFTTAIAQAGEAARDFNEVMASIRQDQNGILNSIKVISDTLEQQNKALRSLLKDIELNVNVVTSDDFSKTMTKATQAMDKHSEVSKALLEAIEQVAAENKKGLFSRFLGS